MEILSKRLLLFIQIPTALTCKAIDNVTREERGNETGKVAIAHGSVEFCEATPIIGLADDRTVSRRNHPCTDARRTETTSVTPTCVAPGHVDASRDFYLFSPNEQHEPNFPTETFFSFTISPLTWLMGGCLMIKRFLDAFRLFFIIQNWYDEA